MSESETIDTEKDSPIAESKSGARFEIDTTKWLRRGVAFLLLLAFTAATNGFVYNMVDEYAMFHRKLRPGKRWRLPKRLKHAIHPEFSDQFILESIITFALNVIAACSFIIVSKGSSFNIRFVPKKLTLVFFGLLLPFTFGALCTFCAIKLELYYPYSFFTLGLSEDIV